jgi:hypothetical protein
MRLLRTQPTSSSAYPLFKAWTEVAGDSVLTKSITERSSDVLLRIDLTDGRVTPLDGARDRL